MSKTPPYILVVDDNKITTKLTRRYLEANGFEASEAYDGIECLERVKERRPDAIIMDVMMPRMDGFDTVRTLKADPETSDIPVAIVTALNDTATQVKAVESGADDFLTKPIEEKLMVTKASLLTTMGRERRRVRQLLAIIDALRTGQDAKADELMRSEGIIE